MFFLSTVASAQTFVNKEFTLPSGFKFLAPQIVAMAHAQTKFIATSTAKEEIIEYIKLKAQEYNLKEKVFLDTLICESNLKPNARGKDGEIGIAQFMPSTWKWFKSDFGDPEMSIYKWEDQIELMGRAWFRDLYKHWSCWKIVTKRK